MNTNQWLYRNGLTLSQTSPGFYVSAVQVFWKHCRKGEIARNKQFLLFPQRFLPVWRTFCYFHPIWNCRLQTLSNWKSLKFVVWERVQKLKAMDCLVKSYSRTKQAACELRKWLQWLLPLVHSTFLISQNKMHIVFHSALQRHNHDLSSSKFLRSYFLILLH